MPTLPGWPHGRSPERQNRTDRAIPWYDVPKSVALSGGSAVFEKGMMMEVESFRVAVIDEEIDDLRQRLRLTRWPDQISGTGWDYGTDSDYLRELCAYWESEFDWRASEARLNQWPQFTTTIDGQRIHFIHARSKHEDARTILLIHGWPSTPLEFLKLFGPLTDPEAHGGTPADAFHVVAPSLPGYGWSGPTTATGWGASRVADAYTTLMAGLGYGKYGIHGPDWGTTIASIMARRHPERLLGLHLTLLTASNGPMNQPLNREPTEAELELKENHDAWAAAALGYIAIQATKPQTLAFALNDSPVGQASWIVEKLQSWTDCHGDLESTLTRDEILSSVSTYWFSGTGGSSARLYLETARTFDQQPTGYVSVPTAVCIFPAEHVLTTRELAEDYYNVQRWTIMPKGGHFASLEQPELVTQNLRAFFGELEQGQAG
ncbi:epoxide hydrolase [Rhodococcus erythropolis]|uniref:epoxide hydrolase family protein n=1 Tax=Rhodococcus erythropolis TaxID=1833 RepID=UPI0029495AA9|nr:epoxide hydrolase [Rhodococcus erythropolis]MDV6212815.1 epoxide hydrolase [Rhodococcus erythropolis]